jgi:hypothetical protein
MTVYDSPYGRGSEDGMGSTRRQKPLDQRAVNRKATRGSQPAKEEGRDEVSPLGRNVVEYVGTELPQERGRVWPSAGALYARTGTSWLNGAKRDRGQGSLCAQLRQSQRKSRFMYCVLAV